MRDARFLANRFLRAILLDSGTIDSKLGLPVVEIAFICIHHESTALIKPVRSGQDGQGVKKKCGAGIRFVSGG